MKLLTGAELEENGEGVVGVEIATVRRNATHCHSSRHCCLCVVAVACVIVTSLQLVLICALVISSHQRDISIDKLQQQVVDLQQTVAILHRDSHHQQQHQQQQQQQHSSVARLDNSHQQDELQIIPVSTVTSLNF